MTTNANANVQPSEFDKRFPGPRVPAHGPVPSPLFVLGERPGEDEYKHGRPFIGASGRVLADWFDRAGMDLDNFRLSNVVNDFKHGNPDPLPWEIERDRPRVMDEIGECQPSVIAAVGAHAVRWLLGDGYDLDTVHGIPIRWYTHIDGGPPVIVVPVYHPANSFYQVELAAKGQADVQAVARVLRCEQLPVYDCVREPRYFLGWAPFADLYPFVSTIAIDTEGSAARPWCLTYSVEPGVAWCIRPGDECLDNFRQELAKFIAQGGVVLLHNSMHDLAVLRAMRIELPPHSFVDTMVVAYQLCLEPQGLKALAYRHAGMEMSSYDELVHDANQGHAISYLLHARAYPPAAGWPPTPQYLTMERVGGKFVPKVHSPWPIDRYLATIVKEFEAGGKWSTVKGVKKFYPIDVRKRWGDIEPFIRKPVEDKYGPMPTATLNDVPLDQAVHYANRDADATLRIFTPMLAAHRQLDGGQGKILPIDLNAIPMFERMQANGMRADVTHFQQLGIRMAAEMTRLQTAIHSLTGAEINPNSSIQVEELLFGQLGLQTGKKTKSKKHYSTNDKVLEGMRFVHPVVPLILDYRECSKIKDSFCDPLSRLTQRDGRIRTSVKITRVASGRPAYSDPNLGAQPVRSELGRELRKGFVAAPGCVIGDWDLNQIEMCEMAHQSQDPGLLELIRRDDRDTHSENAALIFGLPLYESNDSNPKERKMARYRDVDEVRHRYPAKRVGFGVITGIQKQGLKAQMDLANATQNGLPIGMGGVPWSESDCDKMIQEFFKVRPRVWTYMVGCRQELRLNGYVKDRWGRVRYLPGIFSEKRWVQEEAERQSHSHKISSSAQGVMKLAMAEIWKHNLTMWQETGYSHKVGDTVYPGRHVEPLLQIYDSLVYEVEDDPDLKAYWDWVMTNCMCNSGHGLSVPVRAKGSYKYRWGDDK